jgi:hypothetical protein
MTEPVARARYDYVRNLRDVDSYRDRTVVEHALYDIVDYVGGVERVLARNVRYLDAKEIVGALNRHE